MLKICILYKTHNKKAIEINIQSLYRYLSDYIKKRGYPLI